MKEILLKDVPKWLQGADLYKEAFEIDPEGTLQVIDRFKDDVEIKDKTDFVDLLLTCDYFCTPFPDTVEKYIKENKEAVQELYSFANYGSVRELLKDIEKSNYKIIFSLLQEGKFYVITCLVIKDDFILTKITFWDHIKFIDKSAAKLLHSTIKNNDALDLIKLCEYGNEDMKVFKCCSYKNNVLSFIEIHCQSLNTYTSKDIVSQINIPITKWNKDEILHNFFLLHELCSSCL
jgi:hypothetical protein